MTVPIIICHPNASQIKGEMTNMTGVTAKQKRPAQQFFNLGHVRVTRITPNTQRGPLAPTGWRIWRIEFSIRQPKDNQNQGQLAGLAALAAKSICLIL